MLTEMEGIQAAVPEDLAGDIPDERSAMQWLLAQRAIARIRNVLRRKAIHEAGNLETADYFTHRAAAILGQIS